MGWNFGHQQGIDIGELLGLGRRGSGHAGQLRVHAEIILEGDRCQGLVLGLDIGAFLGLQRLVKAVRIAPSLHHPAGKFVNNDDPAVLDDVIGVALEHMARLQSAVYVVYNRGIFVII